MSCPNKCGIAIYTYIDVLNTTVTHIGHCIMYNTGVFVNDQLLTVTYKLSTNCSQAFRCNTHYHVSISVENERYLLSWTGNVAHSTEAREIHI